MTRQKTTPLTAYPMRDIGFSQEMLELAYAFKSFLEDNSKSERRHQACLNACDAAIAKATGEGS